MILASAHVEALQLVMGIPHGGCRLWPSHLHDRYDDDVNYFERGYVRCLSLFVC